VEQIWIVVTGALTGLLGGLFGKGGSSIATPLLAAGGVSAFAALASPLPATIPGTVLAGLAYWRAGEVDVDLVRTTVGFGVPAAIVGALLTVVVGGGPLVAVSDLVIIVLGARILTHHREQVLAGHRVVAGPGEPRMRTVDPRLVAAATGVVSGLLANAGGFLLAPLFVTALRMPIKRALGTSLAAATVLAVPSTLVHVALGHVDWAVTIPFAVASVPLSFVGARIALRTDAARLETLYGAGLVLLGGALLLVR